MSRHLASIFSGSSGLMLTIVLLTPVAPAMAATQAELDAQWQAGTIPFRDVATDNPFFDQIAKLKQLNLTQGTGNGYFEPDRCVSKAEVVKFGLDMAAVPVNTAATTTVFADVPAGWQTQYVETARAKGMLPQVDSAFEPNVCASRIFTLMVILRAAKLATPAVTSTSFNDVTSPEQMAAVEIAKSKNIISGRSVNTFAPYDTTYRKEMAKILVNTYTLVLHPETVNDRRPDYDTAVRIQTVLDNFPGILTANAVASSGTPVITRFAFVNNEYVYVDYSEGAAKNRVLLDITKPDANFRIAVAAAFTSDANGVLVVSSGTDTQSANTTTVYLKEGSLWLKQASVTATNQLFSNSSSGYTLEIPKAWFFWNRGAVGTFANETDFGTAVVTDTNWILAVRLSSQSYGTVAAADSGATAEEAISGGVLRTYADGSHRAFLPFKSTKTLIFEAKPAVTKDLFTTIVQSLKTL